MLKTRVVTALLLFAVFLLALFLLPPIGWAVFATLVSAVAAWEWGGLVGLDTPARVASGVGLALICAAIGIAQPAALGISAEIVKFTEFVESAWIVGRWLYLPAAVFWIVVAPFWLARRWRLPESFGGLAVGASLILPTWLALVQLRQAGALALLAILMLVWLADVAAYFAGRAFGKHKLAPNISPGKTWEGAIGGGVAVLAAGLALAPMLPPEFSGKSGAGVVALSAALIVLTAISIVGDLFESLLKRQAGLKDSSNVLPGHGGILDRIDSQISTLPLAVLVWLMMLRY
ncbi:MAG: phosphatidate cytidylyltransferase [Betaproteobacteria bacterium]|nr:phosphatidate cytidylyltransferase [Betaproteobacteria bacterium]